MKNIIRMKEESIKKKKMIKFFWLLARASPISHKVQLSIIDCHAKIVFHIKRDNIQYI